ncbi:MAG: ABC transporter substrate-binding protein [Chthoniobacterales bacterium]|nr:ABC transporter substrate-binding protein [Chthoniobacterales bacterium]
MKILAILLSTALALAVPAFADSIGDAETTLRGYIDEVLAVTKDTKGGRSMADQLQPILERCVNFDAMTRRAVGPGWRQFSAAQQAEATKMFTKLIIRSYSEKFTPGQQPEISFLKPKSPSPDKVEIPTTTIYKGSRYIITYRLENRSKWVVTDILAEGVSLVANYRAQFDELFKKGGAVAVLDSLKASVGNS